MSHIFTILVTATVSLSLIIALAMLGKLRQGRQLTVTQEQLALASDLTHEQINAVSRLISARQRNLPEAEQHASRQLLQQGEEIEQFLGLLLNEPHRCGPKQHGQLTIKLQQSWQNFKLLRDDVIAGRDVRHKLEQADLEARALTSLLQQQRQQVAQCLHAIHQQIGMLASFWMLGFTVLALVTALLFWRQHALRIRALNHQLTLHSANSQTPTNLTTKRDDLTALEQQLRHFLDQAEHTSRAKDDFFAVMSHEIRTPLNGVVGFLANLGETPLNTQQKQYVRIIEASARSLMHVINDVLDYSKITAGSLELEDLAFDCLALVEDRLSLAKQQAKSKGLKVILDSASIEPLIVRGDPGRLRQVLDNLLNNAVKFTEHGEIKLQLLVADLDPGQLELSFTISDTGIGIAHDLQDQLLKPYAQGNPSIARRFGGTGLGLSIAERLVRLMGGKLALSSRPGVGTQFSFTLRARKARPEEQVRLAGHFHVTLPRQELKKHLALLVDDTPTNLFLLETICQSAGLPYRTAQNGLEAVNLCRQQRFDLIFMDIQMPVMDGYTAIREIRQLPHSGTAHIIALTASAFQEDVEKALGAGSTGFIPKPFERNQLLLSIADALGITAQREAKETCDLLETREEAIARRMHDFMREQYHISIGEIKMVLAQTVADWRPLLDNLNVHAEKNNWPEARAILHRLKGQLSSIGLTELAHHAAEIIDKHESGQETTEAISELSHNLAKIFTVLEQDITIT